MPEWVLGGSKPRVLHFLCTSCGQEYAKISRESSSAFHHFKGGLCASCGPGDKYNLPLSLECIDLAGWNNCSLDLLTHQLSVELAFYDYSKGLSPC